MTFFDYNKSVIENAALISAPLVLIIGIVGLRQLQIAKKSLKINSIRDAAKFSLQIIEDYTPKFEDAYRDLNTAFEKHNIKKFEGEISDFSVEEYYKIESIWREQWEINEVKIQGTLTRIANLLESYSIPFIKKIADEEIAFNADCYIFMQITKLCYPLIVREHNKDKINLINCNTIELYLRWKLRLESLHHERELITLKNKIKSQDKVKPIKPIGVE